MVFIKGHKIRLGVVLSEETKEKIRNSKIGKKQSLESNLKRSIALKGRIFSEEHKKKIGEANKKRIITEESRNKVSGEKCHFWKGGITPINTKIRMSLEYRKWRKAVFERDNYTCVFCKARNEKGKKVILNADHIKSFALFPLLRFSIENGRTLCLPCHKTTDTFGRNIKS